MDQVRVERRTANTTHKRDAEESRQEALARKQTHHKHTVNENRKAMVDEVIIARVRIRAHEEEASVKCKEQKRLSHTAHIIFLENVKLSITSGACIAFSTLELLIFKLSRVVPWKMIFLQYFKLVIKKSNFGKTLTTRL